MAGYKSSIKKSKKGGGGAGGRAGGQAPSASLHGGIARIFPWGGPKYSFQNFGTCNLGEYTLPLRG